MDAPSDTPESWPVSSCLDLHRDDWVVALRVDQVSSPDGGEPFGRMVLEHPGSVIVLAVDEADRVLVLEQYRHPAGLRMVELPAGLLDAHGEEPLETARRELLEEAEQEAATWTRLLSTYPSPGISDERMEIFLATGLSRGDRGDFALEHEEADLRTRWVPVAELLDGVLAGRVTDAATQLAVMAYVLRSRTERAGH